MGARKRADGRAACDVRQVWAIMSDDHSTYTLTGSLRNHLDTAKPRCVNVAAYLRTRVIGMRYDLVSSNSKFGSICELHRYSAVKVRSRKSRSQQAYYVSAAMVVAMQISGLSGKVCVPSRPSTSFAGRRVTAPSNGCRVFAKKEGNWLPGADTPAYLDDLPAYVWRLMIRLHCN